jgi:23S rRNA (cytosine1962-C5)-methyltransferase
VIQVVLDCVKQGLNKGGTDSRRLFHGRGGTFAGLESLTIDFFSPVLWIVLFDESLDNTLDELINGILTADAAKAIDCVLVQYRYRPGTPSELVFGSLPKQPVALEAGLRYKLKLGSNQNCGFFLDMINGRNWLRDNSRGKRVLNLFSYTCALSVAACAGGAKSVVNIDMSRSALRTGQENHSLNQLDTPVRYLGHDIFRSWRKLRQLGPYDLIVVDPPVFQKGSFIAENDYLKLLKRLPVMAASGADILASLNAPYFGTDFLMELFAEAWPEAEFIERIANSPDFPDVSPESSLKLMHFKTKAASA